MDLLIHTHGRPQLDRQYTLQALLAARAPVKLVVQERERDAYKDWGVPLVVLPPHIQTLAPTRDWIIHDMPTEHDHVVFMDDDLDFAVRRDDDRGKFRNAQPADIGDMLTMLNTRLRTYPMVGIGSREGGNRVTEEEVYNTRIMRVLGFSRKYLRKHMITFSPLVVMEDFHVNLQILESGGTTCVCNDWVSNQRGGSNAPGGCSLYRTDAVQTTAAHTLAARHPGFVKVVQKATKTAWGGGTRTDVIVQWKRAWQHGQKRESE